MKKKNLPQTTQIHTNTEQQHSTNLLIEISQVDRSNQEKSDFLYLKDIRQPPPVWADPTTNNPIEIGTRSTRPAVFHLFVYPMMTLMPSGPEYSSLLWTWHQKHDLPNRVQTHVYLWRANRGNRVIMLYLKLTSELRTDICLRNGISSERTKFSGAKPTDFTNHWISRGIKTYGCGRPEVTEKMKYTSRKKSSFRSLRLKIDRKTIRDDSGLQLVLDVCLRSECHGKKSEEWIS